ncbi:2-hydroxyacyl-CoA dehydratase subunit D [Clostridium kluyveri]|uniref:2-hydroxyglutaryl-CoA dehydratase n=1 Tax=Clostridium kluyveri TaxID=1534 RepID=A0A1L5F7H7_CLOKL|nr:2-hydroxyacyl-CoA dehydratase family protein [Clostridium kluyveri]APM38937.1 2-hydroxyglutaryl-CoA dehydratase [Clostridium kluyveri]UZQ51259.1 2-hydroxyacyl-CoA dehydratase family protein [Clostridium kluyveri]
MSLLTLEKINEAVKHRPAELEKARAEGRKVVGWLNYNVPEELIYALDLIPIHLGTGGNDRLVELGARYISVMNCVFTRQVIGLFSEGNDPYIKNTDVVVIDVTCKQLYRVAEIIKHYFSINTEIIGVPYNFDVPAGKTYFRNEIKAFTEKLEKIAGKKIEQEKLEKSVEIYKEIRESIKRLYKWQAEPIAPISWREVYNIVQAGYYLDKEIYLNLLRELLTELTDAVPSQQVSATEPRIFVSGSIIPPGDRKILDIIEEKGGRVVVDDLWSGFAPYFDTEIEEPSIEGISDAYILRYTHASLPQLKNDTDRRLKNIRRLIKDFQANGVLFHTLRYCDSFTFKANETKNVLKNDGIPFLEIHTEYAGSDYGAIGTRIEAFVEMLKVRTLNIV